MSFDFPDTSSDQPIQGTGLPYHSSWQCRRPVEEDGTALNLEDVELGPDAAPVRRCDMPNSLRTDTCIGCGGKRRTGSVAVFGHNFCVGHYVNSDCVVYRDRDWVAFPDFVNRWRCLGKVEVELRRGQVEEATCNHVNSIGATACTNRDCGRERGRNDVPLRVLGVEESYGHPEVKEVGVFLAKNTILYRV